MGKPFTRLEFDALPEAERRIRIAKDALALLKKGKLQAASGSYVEATRPEELEFSLDTQAHILTRRWLQEGCRVCALGAALVSTVRRFDRITVDELFQDKRNNDGHWYHVRRENAVAYLKQFFSGPQLDMLEAAYERVPHYSDPATTSMDLEMAMQFGWRFSDKNERLTAIFQNIVNNGGTFVP